MTSGVYRLHFADGSTYIGKSINCEVRWTQHADKFLKGAAAKAMQAAYNRNGMPNATILVACHEDHIGLVESCYIARHNPTLNSDRPPDPYPHLTDEQVDSLFNTFKYSTLELVIQRQDLTDELKVLDTKLTNVNIKCVEIDNTNKKLLIKRSEEEVQKDITKRIIRNEEVIENQTDELDEQEELITDLKTVLRSNEVELNYHRKPWWWKILN